MELEGFSASDTGYMACSDLHPGSQFLNICSHFFPSTSHTEATLVLWNFPMLGLKPMQG